MAISLLHWISCRGSRKKEVTEDLLDKAFAEMTAFGPNLGLPKRERLEKIFPCITASQSKNIILQVDAVSTTVWAFTKRGGEARIDKKDIVAELQAVHPFLQKEGLNQALFLINYYAWHEGYDK